MGVVGERHGRVLSIYFFHFKDEAAKVTWESELHTWEHIQSGTV